MNFEFAAPRIIFGEGKLRELGGLAKSLGARALLVEGASGRGESARSLLKEADIGVATLRVPREPTTTLVQHGADVARSERCDMVVAIGGGSVIDTGKAVAALLANGGDLLDYLEVVGRGRPLPNRSVPTIAIPTTAGTGAEVTRNAVLHVEHARLKVSLRGLGMLPTIALVDPELTYALPVEVTAFTGLDALTQCLEPFVSPKATPFSDAFAREGLRRIGGAIRGAFHDGSDRAARAEMSLGALCSGLALANAKLGAVHGFAAPLCGMFPVPHGVACARLLAPVAAANVRALRERDAGSPSRTRYDEAARILTGKSTVTAHDLAAWLHDLVEELAIPRLQTYGVRHDDISRVVEQAQRASSMQGNPISLTDRELSGALASAL